MRKWARFLVEEAKFLPLKFVVGEVNPRGVADSEKAKERRVNNGRVFTDEYLDFKDFDSWHHNVIWIRQGDWETAVEPDVKRALEMMGEF